MVNLVGIILLMVPLLLLRHKEGNAVVHEQCYLEDGSRCPRGPDGDLGNGRKRRSGDCSENSDDPVCRNRRNTECEDDDECDRKRRETETEACAICRLNSDSLKCKDCPE